MRRGGAEFHHQGTMVHGSANCRMANGFAGRGGWLVRNLDGVLHWGQTRAQIFRFPKQPLGSNGMSATCDTLPFRADGRRPDQLRPIRFINHFAPHATGSTLVEWGNTRVICAVTVEEAVPKWMQAQKVAGGWVTAEYSMLPYSTLERKQRDISKMKIDGRSQEIQRLIGRAMRAAIDLSKTGARTFWVDCDVLQADGGTRTASITGAFVAMSLAVRRLQESGKLTESPLLGHVAGVSMGIVNGKALLDLNYLEDKDAQVDMNLVMNGAGEFIELQTAGEESTFTGEQLEQLLALGRSGIRELVNFQRIAVQSA